MPFFPLSRRVGGGLLWVGNPPSGLVRGGIFFTPDRIPWKGNRNRKNLGIDQGHRSVALVPQWETRVCGHLTQGPHMSWFRSTTWKFVSKEKHCAAHMVGPRPPEVRRVGLVWRSWSSKCRWKKAQLRRRYCLRGKAVQNKFWRQGGQPSTGNSVGGCSSKPLGSP